jgi:hypothetical protein
MNPITWKTTDFIEKDRHPDWIWYAGLVAFAIAVTSFLLHNLFFGIFVLVAGGTVILMSFHKPTEVVITIEEKGIRINAEFFAFSTIKQFWLDESEKPDKLLILVGGIAPLRVLSLEGVSSDTVRNTLSGLVPELLLKESFGVKILERLGF